MGRRTGYKPLKGSTIRDILANNPQIAGDDVVNSQPEAPKSQPEVAKSQTGTVPVLLTLDRRCEYDTMHPVEQIRDFAAFSRDVIARYEENKRQIGVFECETQDILHYIELHGDLNACEGTKMYRKLREIRRKRRMCKNEIDLLEPVYDFFKNQNQDLPNKLSVLQGQCKKLKAGIDQRQYTLRTGVIQ